MIKKLPLIAIAAALVAALVGMFAWAGEAQQRTASVQNSDATVAPVHIVHTNSRYDAGLRIIHVRQLDADYPARTSDTMTTTGDEIETAVPPKPRRRIAMPTQPRRVLPPPSTAPKRAVLSAPPPAAGSLTPIRPTPRWTTTERFMVPAELPALPNLSSEPTTDRGPPSSTEAAAVPKATDIPDIDDDSPPPVD